MTFLGLLLDTESGRVTLSEESWADLGSSLAPFSPQGGARDLPHRFQVFRLVGSGASGSPTGPVELGTSPGLFSRLVVVYGLDRRFFIEFVTVPSEVLPDLAHWTQATSDSVGMPLGQRDPVVTLVTEACNNRVGCCPWTPSGQRCLDRVQTYQRPGGGSDMADSSALRSFAEWHTCAGVDRQHRCQGCV